MGLFLLAHFLVLLQQIYCYVRGVVGFNQSVENSQLHLVRRL
jgi:hypothetical protein